MVRFRGMLRCRHRIDNVITNVTRENNYSNCRKVFLNIRKCNVKPFKCIVSNINLNTST